MDEEGCIQDIGMTIHPPVRDKIVTADGITMVHIVDGKMLKSAEVPLIIQRSDEGL
jgi:hypothetical protein